MDRERREHEREERMGQLRGSATRALPPGPPTGATANRLRSAAEPVASTPASRLQQAGERAGTQAGRGEPRGGAARPWTLRAAPPASPSRQYFSQSDLPGGQREEGEHEAAQGRTCQCLVLRPHWAARGLPDFSLTGEPPSLQPCCASAEPETPPPQHGIRGPALSPPLIQRGLIASSEE